MKKILILIIYFIQNISVNGQVNDSKIGYYYTIDGESIEDFYDLDFDPKKSLESIHNIGAEFSPGYFYSSNGHKSEGFIRYTQNNYDFKFKSSLDGKAITINTSQCIGFVIGLDSFARINYNDVVGRKRSPSSNNQEFAEVIEEAGLLSFYKQFNTETSTTEVLYYVKTDTSRRFWIFPQKKAEFKEMASPFFSSSENLSKKIKLGAYTQDDLLTIIKLFKYEISYETQGKIYFNSSFNEIRGSESSYYYAKVEAIKDSIYKIVYYENTNVKLFEGHFYSLSPKIKDGEFIYYYPDGSLRKKLFFEKNKPVKGITYFKSGNKHREFSFSAENKKYEYVYDINGNQLLNNTGGGEEQFYDSMNNREIIHQYSAHELIRVYFIDDNGTKVYQYFQDNARIKSFPEMQRMFNEKVDYPPSSIENNTYGIVLLRLQIDPKGKISNAKIIKGVDPDIDKVVLNFVPYMKAYDFFETGKDNGEKVHQEVVVPFDFSLVGFTRTNTYNGRFWLQGGLAFQRVLMRMLIR